jgi:hypothetical protein
MKGYGSGMKICEGDIFMADRVADLMQYCGYADFGDEKVAALAACLCEFLLKEGIQARPEKAEEYASDAGITFLSS